MALPFFQAELRNSNPDAAQCRKPLRHHKGLTGVGSSVSTALQAQGSQPFSQGKLVWANLYSGLGDSISVSSVALF